MPWRFKGSDMDGPIICTGPGCQNGYLPCPVDHAAQPPNGFYQGKPYYRCNLCDWVIPDDGGENDIETAGMVPCPECGGGERSDTYAGPCERCNKLDKGATYRTFPPDLVEYRTAHHLTSTTRYNCPKCWAKTLKETQRDADKWRAELARAEQEIQDRLDAKRQYFEAHPHGTCDNCGTIKSLAIVERDLDLYLCHDCAPGGEIPEQDTGARHRAADNPPPGWYPDPTAGAGWVRYWTGQTWIGEATEQHTLEHFAN